MRKLYMDTAVVTFVIAAAAYVFINLGWTAVDLVILITLKAFWYLKHRPIQSACTLCAALLVAAVIWLSYEIYEARRRA